MANKPNKPKKQTTPNKPTKPNNPKQTKPTSKQTNKIKQNNPKQKQNNPKQKQAQKHHQKRQDPWGSEDPFAHVSNSDETSQPWCLTKTCSTHDSHDVRSKRFIEIRRKKCQHVKTYTWAKFWIDGTRLWIRQTENDPSSFRKLWLIQQWQVMKEAHTLFWPNIFQNELHCCSKRGAIRKLFRKMLSDGMLCFRFVWMSVICERHFLRML